MQHLMIEDIFNDKLRHCGVVQGAADDDRVVNVIMMTQNSPCPSLAPTECRARQDVVEIPTIQSAEELIKIIDLTTRTVEQLAPTRTPRKLGCANDVRLNSELPIDILMLRSNSFAEELRDENVSECAMDVRRGFAQKV